MTSPDCEAVQELLAEVALDVADARDRAQVLAHTEGCAACRRALAAAVASAEGLAALAPPVDPPAGFDLRVMEALARVQASGAVPTPSAPVPSAPTPSGPSRTGRSHTGPNRTGRSRTEPSRPGSSRPRRSRTAPDYTDASHTDSSHTAPRPRLSPHHRPLLAAAAVLALLIGVSGVVGWAIGRSGATPHTPNGVIAAPLKAGPQVLGQVLLTAGPHPWLAMAVTTGAGTWPATGRTAPDATAPQGAATPQGATTPQGVTTTGTTVRCQVETAAGGMVDVGTFSLPTGRYGYWSAPVPAGTVVVGARLVDSLGGVIAAAAFPPTRL